MNKTTHANFRLIVLLFSSFVVGIWISPLLNYIYLYSYFRFTTDTFKKVVIADKLAESEKGRKILVSFLKSHPSRDVSYPCLFAIFDHAKPWDIYSLFQYASGLSNNEYLSLLCFFDYSEQQRQVVDALKYEYLHSGRGPQIRSKIETTLDNFKGIQYELPGDSGRLQTPMVARPKQ